MRIKIMTNNNSRILEKSVVNEKRKILTRWIRDYECESGKVFILTLIQKRPNTCVRVRVRNGGVGVGFSKCQWPDKWDSEYGITLAVKKALAHIVRQMLGNNTDYKVIYDPIHLRM